LNECLGMLPIMRKRIFLDTRRLATFGWDPVSATE
jgi:hypothetical protein